MHADTLMLSITMIGDILTLQHVSATQGGFSGFYASTVSCHHLHPLLCVYVQLSNLKLSPVEGDEEVELPTFTTEDLAAAVTNDMKFEITVQEEKLAQMKPNMAAIAEYRKKVRWLSLSLIRSLSKNIFLYLNIFL